MKIQTTEEKRDEYIVKLHGILQENRQIKSLRYFADQAIKWNEKIRQGITGRHAVILGTGIPEEIIMAAGERALWILGGSHEYCRWSDDLVPRDTDPVCRSVLGYVQILRQSARQGDLLFIIPGNCDGFRKTAYHLIREGEKVCVVEFPSDRNDPNSLTDWKDQIYRLARTVAEHVRGKITPESLYQAVRLTSKARLALYEFSSKAHDYDGILNSSARMLIRNSYSYSDDLDTWTKKLKKLMSELASLRHNNARITDRYPEIILLGSPVYFPDDKIAHLLSDAGLSLKGQADAYEQIQSIIPKTGRDRRNLRKMISTIAQAWYRSDASPAYIRNTAMRRRICMLAAARQMEGVVYHVLKGQIEQDFELSYYEKLLDKYQIPVFRLETDYQYQDVEQLRIRLEAFAEMLTQYRFREKEAI